jgi:glycogenin
MTTKNYSFISVLTTDDYLEGILVLNYSLAKTNSRYPFVLLITPNLSKGVIESLVKHNIHCITIQNIENPGTINKLTFRWHFTYSKLNIFGLNQFDKLVYLDADMLILNNIDELFEKPHMSAVNSGGMLPNLLSWTQLNSGLIVVEPSTELFDDMLSKVGKIENIGSESDQDFLHAYYFNWPNQKELHLGHGYNIFQIHLDEYNQLFGYDFNHAQKPIKIIHYIGETKPWHLYKSAYEKKDLDRTPKNCIPRFIDSLKYPMRHKAIELWFKHYSDLT